MQLEDIPGNLPLKPIHNNTPYSLAEPFVEPMRAFIKEFDSLNDAAKHLGKRFDDPWEAWEKFLYRLMHGKLQWLSQGRDDKLRMILGMRSAAIPRISRAYVVVGFTSHKSLASRTWYIKSEKKAKKFAKKLKNSGRLVEFLDARMILRELDI